MFFADQGGGLAAEAKKVCNMCDVMVQCKLWALEEGITHGILGGMSPRERTAARPAYAEKYGWGPVSTGIGIDWVVQDRIHKAGGGRWSPGKGGYVPVDEREVVQ